MKTLFEALRLPLLEVPGFEADDVLGTVVDRTRELAIDLVAGHLATRTCSSS